MKNFIANSSVFLSEGVLRRSLFDHLATRCLSGHDPRMGRRISTCLLGGAIIMFCITACDDSSSGAGPEPVAEISSSSDGEHAISSSSVTDKETSSGGGLMSSSSVKSGDDSQKSSSSKKGNSSSSEEDVISSSSSNTEIICNDGDLDTLRSGLYIIYRKCENGTWVKDHYDVLSSSSSDAHYDMTVQFYCDGSPECETMTDDFTDPRDNQVYKTVYVYTKDADRNTIIAYRVFAENLNYGQQIKKDVVNSDEKVVEKYCYNDDEWYCDNGFGGLYTWSEAMGLPKACDTLYVDSSAACIDSYVPPEGRTQKLGEFVHRQGICPDGWHVMNYVEWLKLSDKSSMALRSTSAWSEWAGSNDYGFAVLPAGLIKKGEYVDLGNWASFLLPQELSALGVAERYFTINAHREGNFRKLDAASIRCVEDYEDTLWK